jgi:small conductance mechanosensitive channel
VGDTITVEGLEGTVEDIATRATVVSTSDGHRVVIPNAVLFTNPVVVRDASNQRQPKEQPEIAPDGTGASVRG